MRRNVESRPKVSPVDAHERARDYLITGCEFSGVQTLPTLAVG
jgi:hypothetical protein